MGNIFKKLFIFIFVSTLAVTLTGCDFFSNLFSNSKKTAKNTTTESTTTAATSKPAVNSNSDQGPLPADAIARVGNWTLTADEFNQRLSLLKKGLPDFNDKDPQTKISVLEELVRQQLLVKDAESSDIVEQKEIKDAVEDFRRTLLVQELANRITKGVTASDDEAQKYYDQNKNLFLKWKVREIVVADEATAKNLLVQILQGGDFAALAQAQSKAKSAAEGGLIADISKAPIEVQKATSTLDTGGTSSVFKGQEGYYIVHVDEKKLEPFANVKADLISGLTLRKQQNAILEYIQKLKDKNKVEINEELLGIPKK
jgi:peptidyl-prolyl cis-trans isomerase C